MLISNGSNRRLPRFGTGARPADFQVKREGAMKRIVHVVGTGTIGEPLIGLFTDFSHYLGIDEVTFHKRTPLEFDKSRINHSDESWSETRDGSGSHQFLRENGAQGQLRIGRGVGACHGGDRLHASWQPEQGGPLQQALWSPRFPGPRQRVRIWQDLRPRDQ